MSPRICPQARFDAFLMLKIGILTVNFVGDSLNINKTLVALFAALVAVNVAHAQTAPPAQAPAQIPDGFPIVTDRPSFSDGSGLIPPGRWQIEVGGTYTRVAGTNAGQLPELLVRYPLSDRFELRLVNVDYSLFDHGQGNGWQDPGVGFKVRLSRLKHNPYWEPQIALVGLLTAPVGSPGLHAQNVQPTVKLAVDLPIGALDDLGANVYASSLAPQGGRFTQYSLSLYWQHTLSSKLSAYVETYGLSAEVPGGNGAAFADIGFQYLLNKATQVDIRYGSGFNQGRDGYYVGAGIAYRF